MKAKATLAVWVAMGGACAWGAGLERKAGPNNAITDVPGIEVGHHEERHTGTTVVLARGGAVGGVDVRGGAPGTRETDLLDPVNLVDRVNAVVLTGGSAYGLAAADGAMGWLEEQGLGWPVGGGNVVPIVPAAALYDPGRFGRDFRDRPTAEFGRKACEAAKGGAVEQGNVGAGAGAMAGGLKGGLGTASVDLGDGVYVGAIVAVNSLGTIADGATGKPRAADLEIGGEFGEAPALGEEARETGPGEAGRNTTIAVVATNVELTKAQAKKVAQMAQNGLARSIWPAHTMFDGDTVFALSTGDIRIGTLRQEADWGGTAAAINALGTAAAETLARAVVHAALSAETVGEIRSYRDAAEEAEEAGEGE